MVQIQLSSVLRSSLLIRLFRSETSAKLMTLDREILNNPDANTTCICSPPHTFFFLRVLFNSRPEIRLAKAWENYREPKPLLLPASNGEIKREHVRRCCQSAGNPTQSLCISVLPGLAGARAVAGTLSHTCAFKREKEAAPEGENSN